MRNKTTIWLLLAVVLVGLFILLFDRRIPTPQPNRPLVFGAEVKDATFIRFEWGERVLEFEREERQWTMSAPARRHADQGALDRIVHKLSEEERVERITRKERDENSLDVSHFGFIPPRGRLIFGNRQNPVTYLLGKDAPLGDDFYIKKENDEDILRISNYTLELLNTDLENLLDRTLFHGEADQVYRMDIRRPGGYLQVQREDTGPWKVLQPSPGRADQGAVAGLVTALLNARVEKFVEAATVDSALYGLDDSAVEVTLAVRGIDENQNLQVGKPDVENPRLVYAMMAGADSLVAVSTGMVSQLNIEAARLLDRRLVTFQAQEIQRITIEEDGKLLEAETAEDGSWRIVSPVQWVANQELVGQLLRDWTTASIERFLPEPVAAPTNQVPPDPEWTITFMRPGAAGDPEITEIQVFPVPATNRLVEVHVQGETMFSLVSRELIEPLAVNPLAWKDRVVLALSRDDIVRVSLAREGVETAVEKKEEEFVAVGNDPADVNRPVLEALLEQVASLEVWAYLLDMDPDLERLGLKEPGVVLTFGLRGEVGISKSLLIGGVGPSEARYAQIRGQDAVFLLDRDTVEVLIRDLWQKPHDTQRGDG